MQVDPWVGKIPWRRKWQSTPVSLAGKSHGQRNLVGYSPWGHKKLERTEHVYIHSLALLLSLPLSLPSVLNQVRSGTCHLLTKEHLFGPSFSQPPNLFEPFLTP